MTMRLLRSKADMAQTSAGWERRGTTVGFVPTMGALHEGHLSLIKRARRENEKVVVSIFVNPLQFGPNEDFNRYPRPFYHDRRLCEACWVDVLYRPGVEEMYPEGFKTVVEVPGLSEVLCGKFRPGHFRGVATVVLKLLEVVRPDRTYFGEKDYQQLVIVRRMVEDLSVPVEVVGCETVREKDGLALSSRNTCLGPAERAEAPRLHRALALGVELARKRGARPDAVLRRVRGELGRIPLSSLDYASIVDAATLQDAERLRGELRILAAVRVGRTRLIDNLPLICG